jgi:hypothetical protein
MVVKVDIYFIMAQQFCTHFLKLALIFLILANDITTRTNIRK